MDQRVVFPPGESTVTVSLVIIDDEEEEEDEVRASAPSLAQSCLVLPSLAIALSASGRPEMLLLSRACEVVTSCHGH